jgi:hypothetical protein
MGKFRETRQPVAWRSHSMLETLPAIALCRLRHFAPRHGAHIHISISDARAFGLAVKTRGANDPPAIEHDGSPSFLCLYLEREDIAPPAFVANWSDHAQDLERRYQPGQPDVVASFTGQTTPAWRGCVNAQTTLLLRSPRCARQHPGFGFGVGMSTVGIGHQWRLRR